MFFSYSDPQFSMEDTLRHIKWATERAQTDDSSLAALQIAYFFFLLKILRCWLQRMYEKEDQSSRCNGMMK